MCTYSQQTYSHFAMRGTAFTWPKLSTSSSAVRVVGNTEQNVIIHKSIHTHTRRAPSTQFPTYIHQVRCVCRVFYEHVVVQFNNQHAPVSYRRGTLTQLSIEAQDERSHATTETTTTLATLQLRDNVAYSNRRTVSYTLINTLNILCQNIRELRDDSPLYNWARIRLRMNKFNIWHHASVAHALSDQASARNFDPGGKAICLRNALLNKLSSK